MFWLDVCRKAGMMSQVHSFLGLRSEWISLNIGQVNQAPALHPASGWHDVDSFARGKLRHMQCHDSTTATKSTLSS